MKIKWMLVAALFVLANSCKKEDRAEDQARSNVIGQWELDVFSCGECPVSYTKYLQGNGNIIEFTTDGRLITKLKDTITSQVRYEIVRSSMCNEWGNIALQTTNHRNNSPVRFITIENTKLTLSTPNCYTDGAVSTYRRIK